MVGRFGTGAKDMSEAIRCAQCGADNPDIIQNGRRLCRDCATFFYCSHFRTRAVWCPVEICGVGICGLRVDRRGMRDDLLTMAERAEVDLAVVTDDAIHETRVSKHRNACWVFAAELEQRSGQ